MQPTYSFAGTPWSNTPAPSAIALGPNAPPVSLPPSILWPRPPNTPPGGTSGTMTPFRGSTLQLFGHEDRDALRF